MDRAGDVLAEAIMVTGFVFVMMILVEYAQVVTAGFLGRWLQRGGVTATAAAALVGTVPGCLGAFTNVTLYTHRMIPFGTLTGAMIASSGDEAFVMLALFPRQALLLFLLLLAYGILVALLVQRTTKPRFYDCEPCPDGIALHGEQQELVRARLSVTSLVDWSLARATLATGLMMLLLALVVGWLGPPDWSWIRISVVLVATAGLVVVLIAPEHFLQEHLYRHVARKHLPRVFLWVLGILLVLAWLEWAEIPLAAFVEHRKVWALLAATVVGIIPESGPHMIFVTLFAQGAIPFSVLAASCVVQDGHGMLPLLAESRREFLRVKAVNTMAGLALGAGMMAVGL